MRWSSRTYRAKVARRGVAVAALVSFVAANIGWPQAPENSADPAGPRGCCGRLVKLAGPGGCCCGSGARKSTCGCGKRILAVKSAGCCPKKPAADANAPLPALTCHCGDSPVPDYVISSQPKLQTQSAAMPELLEAFAITPVSSPGSPRAALPPETPPPRPSAA